jgi:hypothetical protein
MTHVVASVGRQSGSASGVVSYDVPVVSSVMPTNAASSGNRLLSVIGRGLGEIGFSGRVRISVSASAGLNAATAAQASVWRSDSVMICRAARGVGVMTHVVASVGRQSGSASGVVSFDVPVVSSARSWNAASSGNRLLSVIGRGLGEIGFSGRVRISVSASAGLNAATAARASVWASDSVIVARRSSYFGSDFTFGIIAASVFNLFGSASRFLSYDMPRLSNHRPRNAPATGGFLIDSFGRNFGHSFFSSLFKVDVLASSKAMSFFWRSDSVLGKKLSNIFACFSTFVLFLMTNYSP